MNLTGQSVYQKTYRTRNCGLPPTVAQRVRWRLIRELGCSVKGCHHKRPEIHHCETGMGGRKDHDKVIPLCWRHHWGEEGVHTLGRPIWQEKYGTEQYHMDKTSLLLGEIKNA